MAMQKTIKCPYHGDGVFASMHPEYTRFPSLCCWCEGKLEYETDVNLYHYDGDFQNVNWENISDTQDDFYFGFKCICGDEITLSEGGDTEVCNCGRIYRLSVNVLVDETHMGDREFLIQESNKS